MRVDTSEEEDYIRVQLLLTKTDLHFVGALLHLFFMIFFIIKSCILFKEAFLSDLNEFRQWMDDG